MQQTRTHQKLSRRIAAATLAGILCLPAPFVLPQRAYAETSEEIQAELDAATAELDSLFAAMEAAEAELGKANYDLDMIREEIAAIEQRIAEEEALLEEKQAELAIQVSASYKSGPLSALEVILASTSFDDFVSRVFYANKVTSHQTETVREIKQIQEQLETDRADLEQREAEQVELVAIQEEKLANMVAAQQEQQAYIDQLSEELKAAIEEERRKAAEEARKAAEEAARKAAEEEAARKAAEEEAARIAAEEAAANNGYSSDSSSGVVTTTPTASAATSDQREIAVAAALSQVGLPYIWGEEIPGVGMDCNSLTHYAWGQAGVEIPYCSGHYSYGQFQWMKASGRWVTSVSQLQRGDLVFFSYDGGYTCYHVALYIGNGQIVHAIGYAWGIQVTDINYCSGFCGGGSPI